MNRILIVDCFDSFTYNIFHSLESLGIAEVQVVRYDELATIDAGDFTHLVISPGPGLPEEYPKIDELLKLENFTSILGVCLGLQYLICAGGGKLKRLKEPMHGMQSELIIRERSVLFDGVEGKFSVGHYHSWVASEEDFPHSEFKITSTDTSGNIMSIESKTRKVYGVQFHPESIMTPCGITVFKNWLEGTKSS